MPPLLLRTVENLDTEFCGRAWLEVCGMCASYKILDFVIFKEIKRLCLTNTYIHNYSQDCVTNLRGNKGERQVGK